MASSVKKICWTVLFVVTALIPPASWAHAHLTHQYPAADAEVTAASCADIEFFGGHRTGI